MDGITPQEQPESQEAFEISAAYEFNNLFFSARSQPSILTWRDIYLQGFRLYVDVPPKNNRPPLKFQAAFAWAGGYFTDDDTRTSRMQTSCAEVTTQFLELEGVVVKGSPGLTPILGGDFSWLGLNTHDSMVFRFDSDDGLYSRNTTIFNLYKLGFFAGLGLEKTGERFYGKLEGRAGLGLAVGAADWLLRSDLRHPVSYLTLNLLFRGTLAGEAGIRIKNWTLFTALRFHYEYSPWLGLIIMGRSDSSSQPGIWLMDFHYFALNLGVTYRF